MIEWTQLTKVCDSNFGCCSSLPEASSFNHAFNSYVYIYIYVYISKLCCKFLNESRLLQNDKIKWQTISYFGPQLVIVVTYKL